MNIYPTSNMPTAAAATGACEESALRDVVRLLGGDAEGLAAQPLAPPARFALRRLTKGTALSHEGAQLQALYIVRCGSLKSSRTLEDGYEQVIALAFPGDLLGIEALHTGVHAATDVALECSTVYVLPLASLQALREQCPVLDDAWQRALSRQLARAASTAEMLAAVASEVRLARFLLWLSARAESLGRSPSRLRLSMGRRDIASLLGIAHETVSRSFTTLADARLLKVDNREVDILDLEQLQTRARTTRRPSEPPHRHAVTTSTPVARPTALDASFPGSLTAAPRPAAWEVSPWHLAPRPMERSTASAT